ncbi:MAG: helix-turn-helix domain-containing protein [Flavobacterium sp.]
MTFTKEAEYVLQFINLTQQNIFLTGKAGTGKTTLLREIVKNTHKKTVIVAPTGIAAINAGGVTIHSMFQLPFGCFVPSYTSEDYATYTKVENKNTIYKHFKFSGQKRNVLLNLELLIIDEVSMLRPDLLDAIDFVLQKIKRNTMAFGGVQVLFIGDLLQLPPIIKPDEWQILKDYYKGKFFFHAQVFQNQQPLYIELEKIYRQQDMTFVDILNNLRNNILTQEDRTILEKYINPRFDTKVNKGYITITTHNNKADYINKNELIAIEQPSVKFHATVTGEFPQHQYPIEEVLEFKIGAQVMFIKNDPTPEKRYFNGKMGFITTLNSEEIVVHFPEENVYINVEMYEWNNIKYSLNESSKEIEEEVLGTFVQYPIRLAWAITVHKSQGLTFEKAVLDVSDVFVAGQLYVALSRLTSLNGLVLMNHLNMNGITNEQDVMEYANNKADQQTIENNLSYQKLKYSFDYFTECFEYRNLYFEFQKHVNSYLDNPNKSEKAKHNKWAEQVFEKIKNARSIAEKFKIQLQQIFSQSSINWEFLEERILKANQYFYENLYGVYYDLVLQKETIKSVKKVKEYYTELKELEGLALESVQKLFKAKAFATSLSTNTPFLKKNYQTDGYLNLTRNVYDSVKNYLKNNNIPNALQEDIDYYETKEKKPKNKDQKPTAEITLDLLNEGKTIEEIATQRKYVTSTILGHIAKLIEEGKVSMQQFLSEDKITKLNQLTINEDFSTLTLNELRERYDPENTLTWEELKMYKAGKVFEGKEK